MISIEEVVNVKQAEAVLGVSGRLLYLMRLSRNGPPYYRYRRKILYPYRELLDWKQKHRIDA